MTVHAACDVFCRVVDNFGDAGVAWRLARQLAREWGMAARLFIDDLASLSRLVPEVDACLTEQQIEGVTVAAWPVAENALPAPLVIEAFACDPPAAYIQRMAESATSLVWINLEYLSAESWVGEHHLLPSPHPTLPLTKHFFFPGFTPDTGGLIRERLLLAERDAALSARAPRPGVRILVFGYADAPVTGLLTALARDQRPAYCGVFAGALAKKVQHWRGSQGENGLEAASMLDLEVLSFVPQAAFDRVLWQQDVLFVRGEDSFVRAQWAGKPFVWQIYHQAEGAHWAKLNAFLERYCEGMHPDDESALRELWTAWNAGNSAQTADAWPAFHARLPALTAHAGAWAEKLARQPDLASNLLSFFEKNAKI